MAACNDGLNDFGNPIDEPEGGAVYMDAPAEKRWDFMMEREHNIVYTDMCLGFNAQTFLKMYEKHIDDGDFADLCCDTEAGFHQVTGSNCYYESGAITLTWAGAREDCASRGAHLVMFVDEGEMAALMEERLDSSKEYWLGIHDFNVEAAPECDSATGGCESEFTAWDADHDNEDQSDCVYMRHDDDATKWFFDQCETPKRYVCEQTNASGGAAIHHSPEQASIEICAGVPGRDVSVLPPARPEARLVRAAPPDGQPVPARRHVTGTPLRVDRLHELPPRDRAAARGHQNAPTSRGGVLETFVFFFDREPRLETFLFAIDQRKNFR